MCKLSEPSRGQKPLLSQLKFQSLHDPAPSTPKPRKPLNLPARALNPKHPPKKTQTLHGTPEETQRSIKTHRNGTPKIHETLKTELGLGFRFLGFRVEIHETPPKKKSESLTLNGQVEPQSPAQNPPPRIPVLNPKP